MKHSLPFAHRPGPPVCNIPIRTRLVNVEVAVAALGCNADGLHHAIESGQIEWAFNVACDAASRRQIAVLSRCLAPGYSPGDIPSLGAAVVEAVPWTADQPLARVALAWSISADHLGKLLADGTIHASSQMAARGPYSSPRITCESLRRFLIERRII